jgi:hypothetical protein
MATDELVQIRNNATQTSNELEQMLADNRKTITDLENVIADKNNVRGEYKMTTKLI